MWPNHGPDLVADVTNLHMLPAGYYNEILASDILEHIGRPQTLNVLKEWNRVLRIGGELKIQTVDVIGLVQLLQKETDYTRQNELLQCLYGTQHYPGDWHYAGFTKDFITQLLQKAGFHIANISSKDHWLFVISAIKDHNTRPDEIFRIPNATSFLHAAYEKYFQRNADEDGLNHWLHMLESGVSREAVIEAFKNSEEYKNQIAP